MRTAISMRANQDEQQNQTTITNFNYIQNFVQFKKKTNLLTKSKECQIKLKLNKIICTSLGKIWINPLLGSVIFRQKRLKENSKVNEFAFF